MKNKRDKENVDFVLTSIIFTYNFTFFPKETHRKVSLDGVMGKLSSLRNGRGKKTLAKPKTTLGAARWG